MKYFFKIALILVVFMANSCQEELIEPKPDQEMMAQIIGVYTGVFSVYYQDNDTTYSDTTTVLFDSGYFDNEQNTSQYPLGGNGQITVLSDSLIFQQDAVWPAIYDWNLYLDGSYEYELIQHHLVFHKTNSGDIYTYDLYEQ